MQDASINYEMAARVPGWLERVLLPQLEEVKGEVKALRSELIGEVKTLGARMDGGFAKGEGELEAVRSEIMRLDEKVGSADQKLGTKIDDLDKRMDVVQRLAVVEGKVHELDARI